MKSDSFTDFVLDQLGEIEVHPKPMFGGISFYSGGKIFGMTYKGELYMRGGAGKQFEPSPGHVMKNYFHVPTEVIEDKDAIVARARVAIGAANLKT